MKFVSYIDLTKNEIRNGRFHNLASPPATPSIGQFYFDTNASSLTLGFHTGSTWAYALTSLQLGANNGVASLGATGFVVQNPVNAVAVAAANKIVMADGLGKIDSAWLKTGTGNGLDADLLDAQHGSYYLDRANHSGTQTAATISNLATTVQAYRLDQFAAPTGPVAFNNQKITGLLDPTLPQDAATKGYVDGAIQGINQKASVRAATTTSLASLSAPQTVDGVALIAGDRVLVKDQAAPAANGIYQVNAGAWTRTTDADTWPELVNAFVFVSSGTVNADTGWVCTVDTGGTLNSTAVTFVQFSAAGQVSAANVGTGAGIYRDKTGNLLNFKSIVPGSTKLGVTNNANDITLDVAPANIDKNTLGGTYLSVANGGTGAGTVITARQALGVTAKYAAALGDGSTLNYTINHNLASMDVHVAVYEASSPYNLVYADIALIDTNNISVQFTVAPTSGQYRVVVIG